jgi:glutaconate CoA-transferase subunit A
MDGLMGSAADRVVLQTDRVVGNEVIRQRPERTWYWRDTRVVRAPFGTHPYSSGSMVADVEHLRDYVRAAKGRGPALDEYVERYVRVDDHDTYLEAIGIRRIASLLI